VTVDVGETFLHDAESCDLHVGWKPAKIGWDFKIDFDLAAVGESVHTPAKGGSQPSSPRPPGNHNLRTGDEENSVS
jgi:hypothetical protein